MERPRNDEYGEIANSKGKSQGAGIAETVITAAVLTLPWSIWVTIFIVDEILHKFFIDIDVSADASTIITYVFLILCLIIAVMGAVVSCFNMARTGSLILVILFDVCIGVISAAFTAALWESNWDIYAIAITGPLALLSAVHAIFPIMAKRATFPHLFSSIVWATVTASSAFLLFLDEEKLFIENPPSHEAWEYIVCCLVVALLSACWISCFKQAIAAK